MRIKIIAVLFFLVIVSTFAVAQDTTSSGSTGTSSNTGSFLNSSPRDVQVPSNSGIGNVPLQSITPGTSTFNSQNLNSPAAIDSSNGTPTIDEIVAAQSDLITSTNSFLNPTTVSTSNSRTSTSVLGETIFGNTIVPGMTNVPIVNVVPSTSPLTLGTTTSTNPTSTNPQ